MSPQSPVAKLPLVPSGPGVYLMRNAQGHIIYIGKAKNLRNRLSSYFKSGSHDAKVTAMIAKITDFDYFITSSENDALALEANLIKKHKPHYNILLKDNKTFPYIRITPAGNISVTRKIIKGGRYFGPYFNGIWANDLMDTLFDLFPLARKGKDLVPINKDEAEKILESVAQFLRGEREFNARETLTQKMETAAKLEQYEIAIRYRNGLQFLDKLKERTITQVGRDLNLDVFAHATRGEILCVSVLTIRAGKLIGIKNFTEHTTGIEEDAELLSSFIMQYYQTAVVPEQIIAEFDLSDVATALRAKVFNPKIAIKKQLLKMALANAQEYIETSIERAQFKREFTVGACDELAQVISSTFRSDTQDVAGMRDRLRKIECFDISHTHGEEQVASMVVFIDGIPDRKLYRKFRIRHTKGNDDFLSMQEVLRRRLARLGTSDPSFGPAPDLIVLDGGKGQLSAVLELFDNKLPFQIIALAKENEEIFLPHQSDPIRLPKRSYALRLLQRIRDEAHRFANDYRKVLHKRNRV